MNTNFSQLHSESLHNRFGLRVGARLSAGAEELPHDVSERLRAARERAAELKRQEEELMRSLEGEPKPGTQP